MAGGWGLAAVLQLGLWILYRRIDNASVVDPGWSISFTFIAALFCGLGSAPPLRKAVLATMVAVWSLRLFWHLVVRIWGQPEEGRYQELRRSWQTSLPFKFFLFFQAQAALAAALSVAFVFPFLNESPQIGAIEWAGAALWLVAILGEAAADRQLDRFKANPANKGQVCRVGLWRYSRHPNYFFEWLVWCSFLLFSLGSDFGYLAAAGPALILATLWKVTGIPATEEQALRSRGDAYREYQRTTSAFVPWFPRGGA